MIKSNSGIRKTDVINRRMFIIGAAKVVVFAGIIARLFSLQINENKKYLTLSDKNRIREWKLPPTRGNIVDYFAFNFVHLLIFFWTLRNPDQLGYLAIFFAGIINDVVIGIPIGISSFCYLILCSVTAYIRNITLTPNFMKDWISLLFTILLINSIQIIILDLVFLIKVDYNNYLINSGFTFLFYPIFFLFFNFLNERISYQTND